MRSVIAILLLLTGCAHAEGIAVRNGHVQAQLVSEVESIQPGESFWVAVKLQTDPNWHVYWKNPGDSGLPVAVRWNLPNGFNAGPLQWPYPQKFEQPPLTSYGYEGTVFLLTKIDAPSQLVPGPQTLAAQVKWLVCETQCIPGRANIEMQLPVRNEMPKPNMAAAAEFAKTRFELPLEKSDWRISAENGTRALILRIMPPSPQAALSSVYFFPERSDIADHAAPQTLRKTDHDYELVVPRSTQFTDPLTQVKGVLFSPGGWRGPSSEPALTVDTKVETAAVAPPDYVTHQLLLMLIFAFVGGMILNLMPCVLPVMSLKIFNFIQHSKKGTAQLLLHGLVFTAGILVSFWVLASLLLFLRAAGHQIGWGFQFQSPGFLIFLCVIFFILALNLFGLFEIPAVVAILPPKRKTEWLNVFLSGCLATLSATPCTAPFMGTALGFSLSQPPQISFAIFTALGLGMAFPYLLLCAFPPLLRFVPKPGPWMAHFKKFLGLLLLLTIGWLLWVLWAQVGPVQNPPQATTAPSHRIQWQPFSPQLLQKLRSENKIIFIDFTARWCLTCQVNERIALDHPSVVAKFKELDVAALKADWTNQDPYIAKVLAGYGKNAIPLYVLYGSDPDVPPAILPELITPQIVLEALEKIRN